MSKPFNYHKHACRDRMCGADDCPNCRPENFMGARYLDDNEAGPEDDPDERWEREHGEGATGYDDDDETEE